MTGSGPGVRGFPVDAHVHLYDLDRVGPTFDAAAGNFARQSGRERGLVGAVLLVQTSAEQVFERLVEMEEQGGWRIARVPGEPQSLLAHSAGRSVLAVCGRQVRCARGLEVLALGTVCRYPDGEALDVTVARVQSSQGLAVVPWGFGKWTGARGRQVRNLLQGQPPDALYVGDSGGRLQWLDEPEIIRDAREAGFRVLPGTDPFPCGNDHRRVGTFGFLADLEPDTERPWSALRDWIEAQARSPRAYGDALGPLRFLYNQAGIRVHQIRKRMEAA